MVIRNVPHEYFGPATARAESPVVGHLSGKPVFATVVDRHGRGEWIVAPDLVCAEAVF